MTLANLKNDKQTMELLADCSQDTKLFAQTFLKERFHRPFSALHDEIFAVIDDPKIKMKAIAAPRGFGKSSVVMFARMLRDIMFKNKNFIMPISLSAGSAIEHAENAKLEISANPLFKKLFPNMKSGLWSKDVWDTSNGVRIFPRGGGQQVRGRLYRNSRPDLIIIDDIEDKEGVMNEERRDKLFRWLKSDVMNSVDKGGEWEVIVIGTILHERSLLKRLQDDPDWHGPCLSIADPHTMESNWPELMTTEMIAKELDSHRREGTVDEFWMEYMNMVIPGQDAKFTQDMFRYYEESELKNQPNLVSFVIVDPAKSTKASSAYSGIVGVTVDRKQERIYFRDVVMERLHPDQIIEQAILMAQRIGARVIAAEVTSLNEFISFPFKQAIITSGTGINFHELQARGKKEQRAAALIPFYRRGIVYHNKAVCTPLEGQLLSYPRNAYWDVLDAAAYTITILDDFQLFMDEDYDLGAMDIEAEYESIEEDIDPIFRKPLTNWEMV